jgi:hypothetical protein
MTPNRDYAYLESLTTYQAEKDLTAAHLILNSNPQPLNAYNCWGYTAYLLGWEPCAEWLRVKVMERHLEEHTVEIGRYNLKGHNPSDIVVEPGTVISWWDGSGRWLEHSSIVVGQDEVTGELYLLEKYGGMKRQCGRLSQTWLNMGYAYGDHIRLHRVIREED